MNKLMIKDLSAAEELDQKAMAGVRGGYCWMPAYYARELCAEPQPCCYVPSVSVSNNQVAQAGQNLVNITGSLSGVTFSNTVSAQGPVTATASNSF